MKKTVALLLVLAAILAGGLLAACNNGDDDDDAAPADDEAQDDDQADDDNDDASPDVMSSATPGRQSTQLTSGHSGWQKADCFTCHDGAHKDAYPNSACVQCHGLNGAPQRSVANHQSAASCTDCHADAHAGLNFQAPGDCRMCHGFESTEGAACPVTEEFDVVVIGAGGGGLGAAAEMARNGLKVVVLEQSYQVGGCMIRFKRGDYHIEASLHAFDGLDQPDGLNLETLRKVGILDKITPVKLDPMYRSIFPDLDVIIPADFEQHRQVMLATFPNEAANINHLFDDLQLINEVFYALVHIGLGSPTADDFATLMSNLPTAMRLLSMMNQTLLEFLDEYSLSQPAIALWTQLSAFLGVEPSNLSALMFVVMWVDYYMHGYYYFEGGSGSLTQAMAEVVEENGGQVRLGAKATKIDVADNVASVVHTQRDACFSGRYIVSNANAPDTLLNMVGADKLPADYVQRLNEMTIGLSTFEVYLGVDADLTAAFSGSHEIMVSETFDTDENMGWVRDGNADMAPFAICNYSVVDPTAAPAGKNVIGITSQLPYEYQNTWRWNESYDSYVDLKTEIGWKYIERAEQYVPGLTDHIEVMEVQTPVTVQGYTLNPRGTIFGWDHTVDQTFAGRLANQTPIDNLLLVGAWTNPGAGQSAVIIGGTMVAEKILKKEGITPRNR